MNFSAVDKHGITSPDRYLVAMMTDGQFNAFVSKLQAEQQALRRELAPYEAGKIRVLSGPSGGPKDDITAERIRQIKNEIATKGHMIKILIAERRGSDGSARPERAPGTSRGCLRRVGPCR